MPLTGKYLKYSPEITLEIFTLVWNKLIENGCKFDYSKEVIFERFKFYERKLRKQSDRDCVYPLIGDNGCKETTVQEILGYDPFVKEFVLPDGHPDKIKSNQEFKDGDWVVYYVESKKSHIQSFKLNDIIQVINGKANGNVPFIGLSDITNCFRQATPEEINNHLISIGQIPDLIKQESEKYPFKPLKPGDLE